VSSPDATTFNLNGTGVSVDEDPLTPLVDVLRRRFGLTSVRNACGVGACGSCSVLVDGALRNACLLPVGLAEGAAVTTAEGLGNESEVGAAFVAANAFQCGYCTPGFLVATTALLGERAAGRETDARQALAGNLCRCGSYANILEAVDALTDAGS
jgi:aerobic-type carbon monoxide dehydrogenase small subunit (CoxS/CutS family)